MRKMRRPTKKERVIAGESNSLRLEIERERMQCSEVAMGWGGEQGGYND